VPYWGHLENHKIAVPADAAHSNSNLAALRRWVGFWLGFFGLLGSVTPGHDLLAVLVSSLKLCPPVAQCADIFTAITSQQKEIVSRAETLIGK
jgi:hypothetical protein